MKWPWSKDPDVAESLEAARKALREVRRLEPEVRKVSAEIDRHVMRNHFADSIVDAFRRRA